jgi:ribose 5-phosphate isomerase B
MKKIYIGADSAGYELKEELKSYISEKGYELIDCGTDSSASCHYPEFASAVAKGVQANLDSSLGILVCGTGIGMSIVANKYDGIRASVCGDTFSARMTRMHNDANVLCLGARVIGAGLAKDIVDLFLSSEFEGGRHKVRVDMITDVEKNRK